MSDLFDLTGKVAVVTGSTRGIGRAIAERLAECGASVVVSSRDEGAVAAAAGELAARGFAVLGVPCNVGRKEQLQTLVERAQERFGGIDIVVANAAVNPYYGPLSGISDDAWDKVMNANLRSALWLCNFAFPSLAARGGGSAVFLSSIAGMSGTAAIGAYAVSKAALIQLARNLAVEWGARGIRVNCLAPGIVRTDFAKALWDNPEIADPTVARSALKRLAVPDDVAGAAVFLASPAAAYVTGQTLVVDGGVTIDAGM